MKALRQRRRDVLHFSFDGGDTLDCATAPALRTEILPWIDGSRDVAVDLTPIRFIDSAGVRLLVSVFKAARLAQRTASFHGVGPEVRSVLAIIQLDRIFDLHPRPEEAPAARD